uniref:Uncharacterized protein n=1 Tax=Anguilla anguilla TaxID=7936 RepID=A0A0E9SE13_ANGAN
MKWQLGSAGLKSCVTAKKKNPCYVQAINPGPKSFGNGRKKNRWPNTFIYYTILYYTILYYTIYSSFKIFYNVLIPMCFFS